MSRSLVSAILVYTHNRTNERHALLSLYHWGDVLGGSGSIYLDLDYTSVRGRGAYMFPSAM